MAHPTSHAGATRIEMTMLAAEPAPNAASIRGGREARWPADTFEAAP